MDRTAASAAPAQASWSGANAPVEGDWLYAAFVRWFHPSAAALEARAIKRLAEMQAGER